MKALDHDLESLVDAMAEATVAGRDLLRQRVRLVNLERALDSGLILLGSDGTVRLANERAAEMLDLGDRDWAQMSPLVAELTAEVRSEDGSVDIERAGRPMRVSVTSCEDGAWRLVELRDSRSLESVQSALMVAARVRNLTRLFVGLTHDLKAPLNAITLHLHLLRHGFERDRDEVERGRDKEQGRTIDPVERIGIVEAELKRLQRGLELLLGQAVPAEADRQSFDLREVLSELGDLLRGPARLGGKTVEVDPGDRKATVDTTRDHVAQALLNVAVNGLEAMENGGLLRLRLLHRGDRAQVEVSDTGPGVGAGMRERLFDAYVTGKKSGLGAGLYIARSLLESEGGTIELKSTSSSGTTFTIGLPLVQDGPPRSRRGDPGRSPA